MKIILYKVATILTVVVSLSSCAVTSNTKDISYMEIRFRPLEREDMTLVGNLSATSIVTGVVTKSGKKLDKEFVDIQKTGLITSKTAKEVMYFAPKEGTSITGNLYENVLFNTVSASAAPKLAPGLFSGLKGMFKKHTQQADPAMEIAYYNLIEKYPDIDYFINVRFERSTTMKGSKFSEEILVKADGVQLVTD